jgi:hypothetical protein
MPHSLVLTATVFNAKTPSKTPQKFGRADAKAREIRRVPFASARAGKGTPWQERGALPIEPSRPVPIQVITPYNLPS